MDNYIKVSLKNKMPHEKLVEQLYIHYGNILPTREAAAEYLRNYCAARKLMS